MNKINKYFALLLISVSWAQTWQWTGRTHGELHWSTIETEHFRIHHHQGIENIAKEGASLAEQVRPFLLKQMNLQHIPTIDIIFTAEDEIMNGFALWTYTTFIWVDQNDAAIWLEDEKWLYQVLAHELQHIVFFHRIKTWFPEPWGYLLSKTPGWVVEGLAEYETERWRPYRADISHKFHVLKNQLDKMDPHHDGYSKMLYWSDRFGDSTIVQTLSHRDNLGLYNFEKAFKKHTGITVEQFNEDWRRHMNTYYYGYRAQKEAIEEIGKVVTLPIKKVSGFSFYSDSSKIAISGTDDEGQYDMSLFVVQRDSSKENKAREQRLKAEKKAEKKVDEKKDKTGFFEKRFKKNEHIDKPSEKEKPIMIWDKKEIDFGQFHGSMSWSPNGRNLVYTKYHYGAHQSLVYDLKTYDLETGKSTWITSSSRASYPCWSPNGQQIVYVAHENNVSNLFVISSDGSNKNQITHFEYDTQIIDPKYSPDVQYLVYAKADQEANLDLYLLDLTSEETTRLTTDPAADYDPVWHPGSDFISYTSHAGSTPNIHTINVSTKETRQISDVGDAIWAAQWSPVDSSLMAMTLPDVDTVRIVNIDPHRTITTKNLELRNLYTGWRTAEPDNVISGVDPKKEVQIVHQHDYSPFLGIKHLTSLVLPIETGLLGITQWSDAMSRHVLFGVGTMESTKNRLLLEYMNAMGGPIWTVTLLSEMDIKSRPYDRSKWGLLEENSALVFSMALPYNFGNNMSDFHSFSAALKFSERNAEIIQNVDDESGELILADTTRYLYQPVSGQEGLITISYSWLNKRPHKNNIMIPDQGFGLNLMIQHANSGLFGEFDYSRIITDAFANVMLHKKVPIAFFGRLKTVAMLGDNPPLQDMPAITNDTPIYIGGINTLGADEVVHLRGWNDWRLGDRLVFGTLEARVGNNKFNLVSFMDFGNAWFADEVQADWLFTGGAEARVNLFGLILAYGTAQDFNRWGNNAVPENYLRLSLVNPF